MLNTSATRSNSNMIWGYLGIRRDFRRHVRRRVKALPFQAPKLEPVELAEPPGVPSWKTVWNVWATFEKSWVSHGVMESHGKSWKATLKYSTHFSQRRESDSKEAWKLTGETSWCSDPTVQIALPDMGSWCLRGPIMFVVDSMFKYWKCSVFEQRCV